MKKTGIIIFLYLILIQAILAQVKNIPVRLTLNRKTAVLKIKQNEEVRFTLDLKKDVYYTFTIEQKGIDLVATLVDADGKKLLEQDSPNGISAPERFDYAPADNRPLILSVKPLASPENALQGAYTVLVRQIPPTLETYDYQTLTKDFDILKNALLETRVGLWYSTYPEFVRFAALQRAKIKDRMTALDLYRIIAPLVTLTREGHSNIRISEDVRSYYKQNGRYFPFYIKYLDGKVYLLNDTPGFKTKGLQISKINGTSIETVMNRFLSIEPSDGYNVTGKYRWAEKAFSNYYAYFIDPHPSSFDLELIDPAANEKRIYQNIPAADYRAFAKLGRDIRESLPNYDFKEAASLKLDAGSPETAILTFNSFRTASYKDGRKGFDAFLENSFKTISDKKIRSLIIDLRKNEGGTQGTEDELLSYLVDKPYSKYKYVEIPSFTYSFLQYTDYRNEAAVLEKELKEYFYRTNDGRFLAKEGVFKGAAPKPDNFQGEIYILIGGLTFSGGSEFAALAKNYTKAKFIGEETSGGYYGNTSGAFLKYTLPGTKITGRIPLHKFAVDVKENGIPFGHGVSPDYPVQPTIEEYLTGHDAEMELTKKLIVEKNEPQ